MHKNDGYAFMGAAFEVYNELGYGMAEEVYQQSLEIELGLRAIPFDSKAKLRLKYKGHPLEKTYIPDLLVYDAIVVEIKADKQIAPEHEAQLFNYLRIAHQPVGYLLNFGVKNELQWKRYILSDLKES